MLDVFEAMETARREWQRGRAKRAVFDATDSGAYDVDWRNARNVRAEIDGAPELPQWEIEA